MHLSSSHSSHFLIFIFLLLILFRGLRGSVSSINETDFDCDVHITDAGRLSGKVIKKKYEDVSKI
jgi:hypothetical protein